MRFSTAKKTSGVPLLILMIYVTSFYFANGISVSYDSSYDDPTRSLRFVACSDGNNGLLTKNFPTQGSLPTFPLIGGVVAISGWNSTNCGTCWSLTYNETSINILAVDRADLGFNIAETAFNQLTQGQAETLGRIEANYNQVDLSQCGL